ncbi:MAG: pyruvate dehydrogenase (acetyl-transferring) E1 component subunit alpha [Microbacterium sp.]|nr:pyruvate dehydrogenase (acetyl-transferring) E1 component subunit alpha [Microbacterium sp.]
MNPDYRPSPSLGDGAPEDSAHLLAEMMRIRKFEDAILGLFSKGLVRGSTHLCQGQEAVTVGVASQLRPGDAMVCTYRGHGATIAQGVPLDACFAEILGRSAGLVGGRGGSMHFTDASRGAIGSNGIVGAHLPIAVGAGLSAQYRGTDEVSAAYFGDGATNIGAFHESLNLASIWKLPVVFVLENNQYGEYSPVAATTPVERLSGRAASYGMPGWFVDGNDIVTMRATAAEAVERARAGEGPTLIEADTYRHSGHSRSDPAKYRPADEVEHWFARDPITLLERAMTRDDPSAQQVIDDVGARVDGEIRSALDAALASPEPDPAERFLDVYA